MKYNYFFDVGATQNNVDELNQVPNGGKEGEGPLCHRFVPLRFSEAVGVETKKTPRINPRPDAWRTGKKNSNSRKEIQKDQEDQESDFFKHHERV